MVRISLRRASRACGWLAGIVSHPLLAATEITGVHKRNPATRLLEEQEIVTL